MPKINLICAALVENNIFPTPVCPYLRLHVLRLSFCRAMSFWPLNIAALLLNGSALKYNFTATPRCGLQFIDKERAALLAAAAIDSWSNTKAVLYMAMSLCDDTLLCNFPKCRAKLYGFAWVTACSHVFCDQHGNGELSRSPAICPACSSALSGKFDIVRAELSPPEEYKAMVLAGLRPEIVLDISARALAFWGYQVHQERIYQEYSLSRAETQVKQMEKILTQQNQTRELELDAIRGEVASLKKMMEEYKRKYSEVSERLMERNRQYQKLQGLYDSLRLRSMVGVGEREPPSQPPKDQFTTGFVLQASPQASPQFPSIGSQGDGRLFSCLDPDANKTFFQFSSPPRHRGRPLLKKH